MRKDKIKIYSRMCVCKRKEGNEKKEPKIFMER